jgi:hypothetical protein
LLEYGRPLVAVRVVDAAQLERVDPEGVRELVHRLLESRHALHHAGRPECVLGPEVRLRRERQGAHVGTAVDRADRAHHRKHPAALSHGDDRIGVDRGESAVAFRAEPDRLAGRGAPAAGELLCVAVHHELHRTPGDPRELRRRERLETRALLAAEAAPDVLRPDPDIVRAQAECPRKLLARGEHPLGRDPRSQPVAVPGCDGAVRLERRLDLGRCLELELDRHLRPRERALGVASRVVGRVTREALLVDGLLRVDDVAQHLEVESESPDSGLRGLEGVRRDHGDRLAGKFRLVDEERREDGEAQLGLRREHGPHTWGRFRRVDVERANAPVGSGRPQHGRVEHAGETNVDRVPDPPGCPGGPVEPRSRLADDRQHVVRRPALDVVGLVDERPDVLVAPLHLLARAHEAGGHGAPAARMIARSILG